MNFWYLVTSEGLNPLYYITLANDAEVAKERTVFPTQVADVKRLNWTELSQLTGCIIPHGCNPSGFPTTLIMFRHGIRLVTLV